VSRVKVQLKDGLKRYRPQVVRRPMALRHHPKAAKHHPMVAMASMAG
jgi:hypothetical protein